MNLPSEFPDVSYPFGPKAPPTSLSSTTVNSDVHNMLLAEAELSRINHFLTAVYRPSSFLLPTSDTNLVTVQYQCSLLEGVISQLQDSLTKEQSTTTEVPSRVQEFHQQIQNIKNCQTIEELEELTKDLPLTNLAERSWTDQIIEGTTCYTKD
ncbi:hypothetical protein RCL1_001383 [Eukaryota sp. TZLM3-RCL]